MATLIAVYNSSGCVGRCDANCYEASSKGCDCICGGRNHGAGLQKSMANVRDMVGLTEKDLERYAQGNGHKVADLVAINRTGALNRRRAAKYAARMLKDRGAQSMDL